MVDYSPAGRDAVFDVPDFTDIANLNVLFKLFADTAAGLVEGIIVCTTAGRPATPELGQHIYDTTLGQTMRWDGAAWEDVAPVATPAPPAIHPFMLMGA
jgi:hypothetical protein